MDALAQVVDVFVILHCSWLHFRSWVSSYVSCTRRK